ncbi:hypothetical protein LCGC14_2352360 [marine sediment metagenome]|uniref:Glycosyl transferase family 8 n=1 Tax=marine sediment metagenome TaxID=412755 RepID=A0A0F9C9F4_9ZZZZ
MKTLIYQVAVGEVPKFYKTCIQSVEQYSTRIGADHKVLRTPILKIKPLNSCRSQNALRLNYLPIFEKENAFAYLGEYDKICIIDSDMYIRDTAPNIFDEIDMDTAFAGVNECDMPLTPQYYHKITGFSRAQYGKFPDIMKEDGKYGVPFYNMGLMLFTTKLLEYLNGDTPEQFIRRKEFEGFVNGEGHWKWSTDQTLLNYWVKTSKMPTRNLSWEWNALYKAVRDEVLPKAKFIHFFLSAKLPQNGAEIPSIIKKLRK